jgi:hypothetical protein
VQWMTCWQVLNDVLYCRGHCMKGGHGGDAIQKLLHKPRSRFLHRMAVTPLCGIELPSQNDRSQRNLKTVLSMKNEQKCPLSKDWGGSDRTSGNMLEQQMVGRVGVEPTVSFRRRIMSPLPATSTASGPEMM